MSLSHKEYGSEFYDDYEFVSYYDYINRINSNIYFLRSGRDSIRAVANVSLKKYVLLPSYCCHSMIKPFIDEDKIVLYYKINSDYSICFADLVDKVEKLKGNCLVLLMNYFGVSSTTIVISNLKKSYSSIEIVEDFTHIALDIVEIYDKNVDYYVCSLRKWFPIIEGGILITKSNININTFVDDYFYLKRREALIYKDKYIHNPNKYNEYKPVYRRLFSEIEEYLNNCDSIMFAHESSLDILKQISISKVRLSRINNYDLLYSLLSDEVRVLKCSKGIAPFSLILYIDNRDYYQKLFADRNLYSQVLWPINADQSACSDESNVLSSSHLSIPIDQRYSINDMYEIATIVKEVMQLCKEY